MFWRYWQQIQKFEVLGYIMSLRSAGLQLPQTNEHTTPNKQQKRSRTTSVLSAPLTDFLISNCVQINPPKETNDNVFVIKKKQEKGFGVCGPVVECMPTRFKTTIELSLIFFSFWGKKCEIHEV